MDTLEDRISRWEMIESLFPDPETPQPEPEEPGSDEGMDSLPTMDTILSEIEAHMHFLRGTNFDGILGLINLYHPENRLSLKTIKKLNLGYSIYCAQRNAHGGYSVFCPEENALKYIACALYLAVLEGREMTAKYAALALSKGLESARTYPASSYHGYNCPAHVEVIVSYDLGYLEDAVMEALLYDRLGEELGPLIRQQQNVAEAICLRTCAGIREDDEAREEENRERKEIIKRGCLARRECLRKIKEYESKNFVRPEPEEEEQEVENNRRDFDPMSDEDDDPDDVLEVFRDIE